MENGCFRCVVGWVGEGVQKKKTKQKNDVYGAEQSSDKKRDGKMLKSDGISVTECSMMDIMRSAHPGIEIVCFYFCFYFYFILLYLFLFLFLFCLYTRIYANINTHKLIV